MPLRLLAPMLAQSARLPLHGDYAYEPKWDGFRALVSTVDGFHVRSRRGWAMTALVPELAVLPEGAVYDGELVAFGRDGLPSFPNVCRRLLQRDRRVPLVFLVFDLLAIDGEPVLAWPYGERRTLLESLDLAGPSWQTTPVFDDGESLFAAVCDQGLEGIVAKRRSEPYRPGERAWAKVKNRAYWRYPLEVAAARERRRERVTI
jgi:bifunctional non-homologous end joining protein LigD